MHTLYQPRALSKERKVVGTDRFNALKNLLFRNSYCDEKGDCFPYPGLLLEALREAKSM